MKLLFGILCINLLALSSCDETGGGKNIDKITIPTVDKVIDIYEPAPGPIKIDVNGKLIELNQRIKNQGADGAQLREATIDNNNFVAKITLRDNNEVSILKLLEKNNVESAPRLVSYFKDLKNRFFLILEKLDDFDYEDNKIIKTLSSLAKIHRLGVAHNNIQPSNIKQRGDIPVFVNFEEKPGFNYRYGEGHEGKQGDMVALSRSFLETKYRDEIRAYGDDLIDALLLEPKLVKSAFNQEPTDFNGLKNKVQELSLLWQLAGRNKQLKAIIAFIDKNNWGKDDMANDTFGTQFPERWKDIDALIAQNQATEKDLLGALRNRIEKLDNYGQFLFEAAMENIKMLMMPLRP